MVYKRKSYCLAESQVCFKSVQSDLHCITEKYIASKDETDESKRTVKHNPFLGFFFTFLTSLNFTLSSVMMKKLYYIDAGQLSLVRNFGVLAGSIPVAVYCVKEVLGEKKDRILLLTRGLLGSTALYLSVTAYKYLPLAEAAVILSTTPALTTLMGRIYLKEPCGRIQILSLVLTICGVIISVRLPDIAKDRSAAKFDYLYIGGLVAAVGTVMTLSTTLVTLRKMKHMHFSVPMLYYGFLGVVENAVINSATSSFVSPNCGWDHVMYVLIAPLGFISNVTFTLSVQVQAAGIVSVLKSSLDIVIAFTCQLIFFSEIPDAYNISGACLVIASVTLMGIRNWLLLLPEESKMRKRLKYFLL